MRPYARYPTGFPVGFFFAFYFFWVGGPVGHKHIQPTRESRLGGEWWVGPKGTSTKPILNVVSHKFLDTIYGM